MGEDNNYRIWAKNVTATYYIGIFSGVTPQEAIRNASEYFLLMLRRERKSKEASYHWVYNAELYTPEAKE